MKMNSRLFVAAWALLIAVIAIGFMFSIDQAQPSNVGNAGGDTPRLLHIERLDFRSFCRLPDFRGSVVAMESLEPPPQPVAIANFYQRMNFWIQGNDGNSYLVEDVYTGHHAKEDILNLVGKEQAFPQAIWVLRDTAGID